MSEVFEKTAVDHELKCYSDMFKELVTQAKKFETRQNDRDYKPGQYIRLYETIDGERTGWYLEGSIGYILDGGQFGIEKGYVAFTFDKAYFAKEGMEQERGLYQIYYTERGVYQRASSVPKTEAIKEDGRPSMDELLKQAQEKKSKSRTKKK